MDGPAILFHDRVDAESALSQMDREGLTPDRVLHAPRRVVLDDEDDDALLTAGVVGAVLGVAAFVLLTVASVVFLDDAGRIGAGTYAFILFHAVLIGVGFGAGYGLTARAIARGDSGVTLHGDDVLVVGPDRRIPRLKQICDRYGGRWLDPDTLRPAGSTRRGRAARP